MNRSITHITLAMLLLLGMTTGCVKNDFDEPDNNGCIDEGLVKNITIQDLKGFYNFSGAYLIEEDLIIEGVVVSDDRDGNFYKELVIQDETGGILIMVDQSNLYTSFPAGRKVYVKVKDMYLDDYGGLIQLGASLDEVSGDLQRIPQSMIDQYIFKGACGQVVDTLTVSMSELDPVLHQSRLVKLTTLKMAPDDADVNFADPSGSSAQNRTFKDCAGNEGILRNSDFAEFAGTKTPTQSFDLVGVFSVFNSDVQFKIRTINDLTVTGETCPCLDIPGPIDGTTTFYLDNVLVTDASQNTLLDENFETQSFGSPLNMTNWVVYTETGSRTWDAGDNPIGGNTGVYGRARVYGSGDPEMTAWLITPGLAISADHYLNFQTYADFVDGAALVEVFVSTDFDGVGTPTDFTWEKICPEVALGREWTQGGPFQLGDYAGSTIYIAFKYRGGDN